MTSCSQWPQRVQMPWTRAACAHVGSPYPGGGVSVILYDLLAEAGSALLDSLVGHPIQPPRRSSHGIPLRSPAERSAEQPGGEAGVALRTALAAGDEHLLAARDRDAGARARDRGVDQLARHERELLVG